MAGSVTLAAEIADLTRRAYAGSDRLPGLPPPDGSRDTAHDVARELGQGCRVWLALEPGGRPAAALRVIEHADRAWEVRRVSVLPAWRGRRVARQMLKEVEDQAVRLAVPRIWLNAAVERCLPPVYARLGYRTVARWPMGDKPMTETLLERQPTARGPALAYPWEGDRTAFGPGVLVSWFVVDGVLLATIALAGDDLAAEVRRQARHVAAGGAAGLLLAGADLWPGAGEPELTHVRRLLGAGERGAGGMARFPAGRAAVPAHLLPRTLAPQLLAVWRFAPGQEAEMATQLAERS